MSADTTTQTAQTQAFHLHLEFYGIAVTAKNWPALKATLDEWVAENSSDPEFLTCAIRAWAEIQAGQERPITKVTEEGGTIVYKERVERWYDGQ